MDKILRDEEEKNLKETLEVINNIYHDLNQDMQQSVVSIQEFKKYIWENKGSMDSVERRESREKAESDVKYTNQIFKKLNQLKIAKEKPYFGRVDFNLDDELLKIYIGICGIEKNFNHYIYDWRTPIASLFYNYGVGPAKYGALTGVIPGNITLKRQYKIEEGILKHCIETNINIDDSYLQDILAESRTDKMKNIVNTIQQEQNEVIRNILDKILVVQGSAGSGKTSVALHRIAYLLYQDKELLSNEVIIFSPNDVFSNYISNVLPELGENNVLETTFSDFSHSYLSRFKKIENYTEFSERYYKNQKMKPEEYNIIKAKLSDEFSDIIDNYLKKLGQEIHFTNNLVIKRDEIKVVHFDGAFFSKREINNLFNVKLRNISLGLRLDYIAETLCDRIGISYKQYSKTIKRKLKEIISYKIDLVDVYNDILKSDEFKDYYGLNPKPINKTIDKVHYEDITPLLYLDFELSGYPSSSYIKQVVIDEAQDYTRLQFRLLDKVFGKAAFTILGDSNQTISPFYKYNKLSDIINEFNRRSKYIELNKTYRSTPEIIEHNNKILNISNAFSVRVKNNYEVLYKEYKESSQISDDILNMQSLGMKKIAVITKNNEETAYLYKELKELVRIKEVSKDSANDVIVLPVYLSKGLEFDGVIVYTDKLNKYSEIDKNLFYVACTRAQHKLIIYNQ